MAAVDLNTGLRIWTAKQGSQGHILDRWQRSFRSQ
jgi:hypothetical protein